MVNKTAEQNVMRRQEAEIKQIIQRERIVAHNQGHPYIGLGGSGYYENSFQSTKYTRLRVEKLAKMSEHIVANFTLEQRGFRYGHNGRIERITNHLA